jgi:hypothetical protein
MRKLGWEDGLLCPQLLFANQALHEFGPFFLIDLDAFSSQHFADLRNASRAHSKVWRTTYQAASEYVLPFVAGLLVNGQRS